MDRVTRAKGRKNRTTDELWFRADGADPVIDSEGSYVTIGREPKRILVETEGPTEVRLVCGRAIAFTVVGGPS